MPRHSTETAVGGSRSSLARRSDRFLSGLSEFDKVTFVSHVHPDPDSLGSMMGLAYLVDTCLGLPTTLTIDGQICRAENRTMVETLGIELTPIQEIEWSDDNAVVMVDSQPKTGRHSFNGEVDVWGVIDHHQTPGELAGIPFLDIRRGLGATCSLVSRYLIEQDLEIPQRIATALYYGISTELGGYPREAARWTTPPCNTCIRWWTRTSSTRSAMPRSRTPSSRRSCTPYKAPSSTTSCSSAGSTTCPTRRWRRRWSTS
jgi:hypothetical protein